MTRVYVRVYLIVCARIVPTMLYGRTRARASLEIIPNPAEAIYRAVRLGAAASIFTSVVRRIRRKRWARVVRLSPQRTYRQARVHTITLTTHAVFPTKETTMRIV